jgi:hypothetical protein
VRTKELSRELDVPGTTTMIFRLSQTLNAKIKAGALAALPLDGNPFADWTARLFIVDRTQYIMLSNTRSLYSTVLRARGITDSNTFIECALDSIREFMQDDGQEFVYRRFVAPASGAIQFAKALNRSVTGSMNDLIRHATVWLSEGDFSPHEVGFRLNDILLLALARSKTDLYRKPREAFKDLVNEITP